jgi:hypothetical protein
MAKMKISSSAGAFQEPEIGTYPGVCVRFIDLGTQTNEYEGKKSSKRQVMLQFELHGESLTSDASAYMLNEQGQPDPLKPFLVGAWLTASFHEEATLRKYMENWRGVPYTDEQIAKFETEGFDWNLMLGVPCMIKMAPNTKGKIKIQSVDKLQKNLSTPIHVNEMYALTLDEFEPAIFEKLSDGLKDIIRKSPEWRELNGLSTPQPVAKPVIEDAPFDDEIPF